MKNAYNKIISLFTIFILSCTSFVQAFAQSDTSTIVPDIVDTIKTNNISTNTKNYNSLDDIKQDYNIASEVNTPYGKMYFLKKKGEISTRAVGFWDVVDIAMAIDSWAKLFNEPTWEN